MIIINTSFRDNSELSSFFLRMTKEPYDVSIDASVLIRLVASLRQNHLDLRKTTILKTLEESFRMVRLNKVKALCSLVKFPVSRCQSSLCN